MKRGARVAVYGWKGLDALAAAAPGEVHRAEELELLALDSAFLDAIAATLERTNRWELSISGGTCYLGVAGQVFEGAVRRLPIAAG